MQHVNDRIPPAALIISFRQIYTVNDFPAAKRLRDHAGLIDSLLFRLLRGIFLTGTDADRSRVPSPCSAGIADADSDCIFPRLKKTVRQRIDPLQIPGIRHVIAAALLRNARGADPDAIDINLVPFVHHACLQQKAA